MELAEQAGQEAVVLSPSRGVDVRDSDSLAAALANADVVIDVTNAGTVEQGTATEFFTAGGEQPAAHRSRAADQSRS